MKNALRSASLLHSALVIGCVALLTLAFASTTAQHYRSARHWLAQLTEIDVDNWAKTLENRQSVVLGGPLSVELLLEQEVERARLPIKRGRVVREQVAMRMHPSAAEVRHASMETLLTSLFRDVETPQLFYPDEQSLRTGLRKLFTEQFIDSVQHLVLSRAVLDFDTARAPPDRAILRLEWYSSDTPPSDVSHPAVVRELPLAGEYKYEKYDFEQFIRHTNPELMEASLMQSAPGEKQAWSLAIREQLSPVWGEIKDLTLAAAYAHVQERLNKTRGNVSLFGLTIYRQKILVLGSVALLLLECGLMLSLRRLNDMRTSAEGAPHSPWGPRVSGRLALVAAFLSVAALPLVTFGFILVRFGEAKPSAETVTAVLAAVAGAIGAIQAYRSILELQRPKLSEAAQRRLEVTKARMASYRRAALPPYRVLGRTLLTLGLVAGPLGAVMFSFYLLGLGLGSQSSGVLPLLAILLSPACVLVGWVLASGRKELLLFLRRFGNEALNDSVRDLVQTTLRRRTRLVTLDDSAFVPLGPRWRGLAVSLMPSGVVLGAIALGYTGFATVAQSELEDETPFGVPLALIQSGIVLIGFVAGATVIFLLAAALRAHFVAHRVVQDAASRARVLRRLRRLRSLARAPAIAAPMATVVSVADSEWQATVASIARMCDVTLIDISHPRENIRWELATLVEARVRIILLAQREALARWWEVSGDDVEGQLAAQLRRLANGLPLVTYDEPDRLNETNLLQVLSAPADSAG